MDGERLKMSLLSYHCGESLYGKSCH